MWYDLLLLQMWTKNKRVKKKIEQRRLENGCWIEKMGAEGLKSDGGDWKLAVEPEKKKDASMSLSWKPHMHKEAQIWLTFLNFFFFLGGGVNIESLFVKIDPCCIWNFGAPLASERIPTSLGIVMGKCRGLAWGWRMGLAYHTPHKPIPHGQVGGYIWCNFT